MSRNFKALKPEILEKFKHQCAYCGVKLYDPLMADIEHFYPKSTYPHLALDKGNMLIACRACNMIKGASFPVADDGRPLLLNPLHDDFSKHIKQNENGYLEGVTEQGEVTISVLQLNRPSLIEQRILEVIGNRFSGGKVLSEHDVYMTFTSSMQNVIELNGIKLDDGKSLQKQMAYMLYANVITSLETYLCDRFISLVQGDKGNLRAFVENFNEYGQEKFFIAELFKVHEGIEAKAIESMKSVLYHNLPKVSGMYRDTFGVDFPVFTEVFKSVLIRHDLVHRAGKTKAGDFHDLTAESVETVVSECSKFVEQLEKELRSNT